MKKKLRTQCPKCHTTFALSREELDASAGLVRCGHCDALFHADQHLLASPAEKKRTRRSKANRRTRKHRPSGKSKERDKTADDGDDHTKANESSANAEEFISEELAKVLGGERRQTRSILWGLGALVLLALLAAQLVFFYSSELARFPQLEQWVRTSCEWLHCEIRPRQNVELIELLRTSVAPHPERTGALRIRASMVNRADFTQPYPVMEVALTDTAGAVVARRTFAPRHYLSTRAPTSSGMVPHVVVDALLDISNPDPSPGGYEIRLLPR